jgi:NitT/TauT family transport system substrate-binding protein
MKQRVAVRRSWALRAVLLAPIVGRAAPAAAQPTPPVAFVVSPTGTTGVAPLYYAAQQHLFERAGLDITIVPASGGAAAMTAVVGGAAQVGFTNTLQLVTAHAKGIPLTAIAPGTQSDPNHPFALLVVRGDSAFKAAKELEGHVIAVAGLHDLTTVAVTLWLLKNGADPTRVKYVEMPPEAMLPALTANRIDAFMPYEPFLSAALAGGAKTFASPMEAIGRNTLSGAWFALLPWASLHREAVLRFARVLSQASLYVDDHYEDLIPMIAQYSKIPEDTLQRLTFNRIPVSLSASSLQSIINAAAETHEIPAPFPAKDIIFPS